MKIGLLLAGHTPEAVASTRGDFDVMFRDLLDGQGFAFSVYDVEGMVFPDSVHDADGWLISGSRHGTYEDHPFIPPLEGFVRDALAADVPMVGICFGHQLIAQALGGRVEKFAGGWSIGRREYDLVTGGTLALNAWHQDQVTVRPDGAVPLGGSAFCENAILAYGRRAFTVQPHPEFDNALMRDYVAARRGTGGYPDEMMDIAIRDAARPTRPDVIADAIGLFFRTRQADVRA